MDARGTKMSKLFAVCLVLTMLCGSVMGQSGCTSALMGLAPCLSYISGSSDTPGTSCCTQLENVVKTQASCLCQVLNGSGTTSFGVTINQTQAMQLPAACKVETPPVSQCKAANQPSGNPAAASPATSPTSSPADASTTGSSVPTIPSPTGLGSASKSTTGSTSAGNMNTFPLDLSLFILVLVSSASIIITM